MQATCIELLASCATIHYVNGIVETDTREPMSLGSFCRGMAEKYHRIGDNYHEVYIIIARLQNVK